MNEVAFKPAEPQAVVVFGASGDLARRKLLPAFYHLFMGGMLPEGFALVGYARTTMTDEEFQEHARRSVEESGRCDPAGEEWENFRRRLSYVPGAFDSEGAMEHLREHLERTDRAFGTEGRRFYYCATPPAAYPQIVARLAESGMNQDARIVVEKPFGRDLESARELNARLHATFSEAQIFRIDHYLGKETVQNILAFRFANGMFEPIWNRRYVDNVQITVAEDIGIEGRGAFYEQTGAIRDMLQTHLLQVLTFLAMEPPVSFDPDRLRDEKVKVLRSMNLCTWENVVRGQYRGYREEPDVAKDSPTETFVVAKLEIDNWRWAGVPFFLRTGKKLIRKITEISLSFRDVPYNVFKGTEATPFGRDHLSIRIQPNEGISLDLNVKKPGPGLELDRARLDFDYDEAFETPLLGAYELLILEAMEGDHSLFTREDEVERAWEVLMPILEDPPPVVVYEPGSWGPEEADALIMPRHWHVTPLRET
ncbi:MAG: glucose-6-phosphate dehydrogenase [Actinomycetota bacterium]